MPIPQDLRDQLASKRAAEHREALRDTRRDLILTALQVIGWCAGGIALVLFSFHVSELSMGRILFWAGLGAGNGGSLFALLAAYRRGEKRGDW